MPRLVRNVPPWRAASSSTNTKPALWRVCAYSGPGLPSPTMSFKGRADMQVQNRLNRASHGISDPVRAFHPCAARATSCRPPSSRGSRFLLLLALLRIARGGSRRCCTGSGRRTGCCSRALGGRRSGGFRGRLRLLGTRAVDRDHRSVLASQLRNHHARRQRDVGQELGVVEVHAGQVQLEELGQVLRQAAHFDVRAHVRHDAALGLHARGRWSRP